MPFSNWGRDRTLKDSQWSVDGRGVVGAAGRLLPWLPCVRGLDFDTEVLWGEGNPLRPHQLLMFLQHSSIAVSLKLQSKVDATSIQEARLV